MRNSYSEVLEPGVHEIVIGSDDYPELLMTLAASEEALRVDLLADPLRIGKHRATKGVGLGNVSFDDRAFVRLSESGRSARPRI
jgi:hypothetical protein